MNDILQWSAAETAAQIRQRTVSITEVTEAHLRRIDQVNPKINAITVKLDEALDTAKRMDATPPPNDPPPLYGVPVTTKINADQKGQENSNGVAGLAGVICTEDSPVVANLRTAGAVIIGRTNTPEFSLRWCTSNPKHGVTLNPWNPSITPGGSSGGAAAAVATGIGCIAHGNDLGGSLRYPAFCCGVAAIKPSTGRVPAFNPSAVKERPPLTQTMSVQGPIARSIEDVRLGLLAMAQHSPYDPMWRAAPDSGRPREKEIVVGYAVNPFNDSVDPAIENAVLQARNGLECAGIVTREVEVPMAEDAVRLWGELLFTETEAMLGETISSLGSAEIQRLVKDYLDCYPPLDLNKFLHAMSRRVQIQRAWCEFFEQVDLLLMPTSMVPAFENDLDFKSPEKIPDILKMQKPLYLVNVLGLPSVAVPTSLAAGIPIGVQLVAPMFDDYFALEIAAILENQLGRIITELNF